MNAAEKLEYERRAGVYTDPVYSEQVRLEELYNSRLEEVKRGVDTYWLSQPLTTSLNQRYSLNFEGGDTIQIAAFLRNLAQWTYDMIRIKES